jgi:replicative DNA helicase
MQDIISEHALLGAVLLNQKLAGGALLTLDADEFSPGPEKALAGLLMDLLRKGEAIDPIIIEAEARSRGIGGGKISPSYLHTVTTACSWAGNAEGYAARVREVHRHRVAANAANTLANRLTGIENTGELSDIDTVLDDGRSALGRIPEPLNRTTVEPPQTLDDLLAIEPSFDWLVPHLLERSERLMLTGQEGLGKSMLLRQLGACLAAGVHPFTFRRFGPGLRVLHVDVENGVGQSRRAYAHIAGLLGNHSPQHEWRRNLMIECRPDGLDLPGEDRAWWDRICSAAAPDVIITGPIYRLFLGNPNSEEDVRKLIQVLDAPRVRHNAALILEAHAGHGVAGQQRAMRPSGASMWLRWPENGLGLIRAENRDPGAQRAVCVDVKQWRMAREERAWPSQITHGSPAKRQLPWIPDEDGFYTGVVKHLGFGPKEETA